MTSFEEIVMKDAADYYIDRMINDGLVELNPGITKTKASDVIYNNMMNDGDVRMDIVFFFWKEKLGMPSGESVTIH